MSKVISRERGYANKLLFYQTGNKPEMKKIKPKDVKTKTKLFSRKYEIRHHNFGGSWIVPWLDYFGVHMYGEWKDWNVATVFVSFLFYPVIPSLSLFINNFIPLSTQLY